MMRLTTHHSAPEYRLSRHYPIAHWSLTLLIAPVMLHMIDYLMGIKSHVMDGLLELYPFALIFSMFFSIPTLIVYYIIYKLLSGTKIHHVAIRLIMMFVAFSGLCITIVTLGGSMVPNILYSYGATLITVGFVLRIKYKEGRRPNPNFPGCPPYR